MHWFPKAQQLAMKARAAMAKPQALLVRADTEKIGSLYLYGAIGADWFGDGLTAKSVVDAIAEAKTAGCTALDVRILSEGGDVFEGKGIYEAIKRCGMKTTSYNDGLAASAASFIAMAADEVVSAPQCTWMLHEASGLAWGRAQDMRAMADVLDMENGNIAAIYSEKTGKTQTECLDIMSKESWLTADQAKEMGLCDKVAREDDEELASDDDPAAKDASIIRISASTQTRIAEGNRARIAALAKKIPQGPGASPGKR